ncbi:MAG: MFS transporter [Coraliomargarita sp.]
MAAELEAIAQRNVHAFTLFRMFFSARFYYPVYALLFLDYGLTLEQFGILNGVWAVTIVLSEIPSGALADTIGRRNLLIVTGMLMLLEMGVLLVAPIDGGTLLFVLFLINRILSGLAEAAASGADEALAYDSLKAAGLEDRWGHVLERVQRDTSMAFFFAMMIGSALYDPNMVNAVLGFLALDWQLVQEDLIKVPLALTFCSGLVVLTMAFRMKECVGVEHDTVAATLKQSWRQTIAASKWIWGAALPFGILLAVMSLDSVIRQFLTLASEYWNVIDLPIASYGLIGSGMALVGMVVPRFARILAEKQSPIRNYLFTVAMVFVGLVGLGFAIPYWGIVPAVLLYAAMHFMGFFVSRYLNEAAPSEQRATVLSFKGLTSNFAFGAVALMYSGLIVAIKASEEADAMMVEADYQKSVFIDSLQVFPWYFLGAVALVFVVHRLKFGKQ